LGGNVLKNPFGFLFYLLFRNDIGWKMLSDNEKQMIIKTNKNYNTQRQDYANPEMYGINRNTGGENWDNFQLKQNDIRAQILLSLFNEKNSKKVLEIGPGAGFHTKLICEHNTVREYTAVDIGKAFLDYLKPRLEKIKEHKDFKYNLIVGEITEINLEEKFDLIVLLSTVHHIPNRVDLFKKLSDMLIDGGYIFCFDPSHYIPRILGLIKKCIFNGYLQKEYYLKNPSTHNMCSLGEYKHVTRQIKELKIENTFYKFPKKAEKFKSLFCSNKLFSNEIGVIFKKSGFSEAGK
jgi:SAM-dependent methyltransferase